MEDLQRGVIVPDLTEYIVEDPNEIYELIKEGNSRRMMAPTGIIILSYIKSNLFQ